MHLYSALITMSQRRFTSKQRWFTSKQSLGSVGPLTLFAIFSYFLDYWLSHDLTGTLYQYYWRCSKVWLLFMWQHTLYSCYWNTWNFKFQYLLLQYQQWMMMVLRVRLLFNSSLQYVARQSCIFIGHKSQVRFTGHCLKITKITLTTFLP